MANSPRRLAAKIAEGDARMLPGARRGKPRRRDSARRWLRHGPDAAVDTRALRVSRLFAARFGALLGAITVACLQTVRART